MSAPRVRVAVDLLGGDHAPDVVVDGALAALESEPSVQPILIGPPRRAAELLAARDASGRLEVIAATQVVAMDENPGRGVRSKRDATVRVAAQSVRDGAAEAMVSAGSTGAAMAAAMLTLGRLPGVTRPALAMVVAATDHPVVLLDIGANVDAAPELLAQFALAGTAYARVRLGLAEPRVGLLSIGAEDGKGDGLRKEAYDTISTALDGLPASFVGNVEGNDVPVGGRADVIVTDGLTGNVLLKGLEGMVARIGQGVAHASNNDSGAQQAFAEATAPFNPDVVGGAVLLGVAGVVVIGHGASSARAIESCILAAARAAVDGLVPNVASSLADLVARRRAAPG